MTYDDYLEAEASGRMYTHYLMNSFRYYQGEEKCPFDNKTNENEVDESDLPAPYLIWDSYYFRFPEYNNVINLGKLWYYEKLYAEAYFIHGYKFAQEDIVDAYNNYDCEEFEKNDGTPKVIKVFFWYLYYLKEDRKLKIDENSTGFKNWYLNYYRQRETNYCRYKKIKPDYNKFADAMYIPVYDED